MTASLLDRVAAMRPEERAEWLGKLSPDAQQQIATGSAWWFIGRPEQFPPPGEWRWWVLVAGRGMGKDLYNGTMIPTPHGWTTLRDIAEGDVIFDEAGSPTTVLATYDTNPERCYRLHFSDGTTLDAGEGHQWVTWTHAERKAYLRSPYEPDTSRFPENWPAWRLRRIRVRQLGRPVVEEALRLYGQGMSARAVAERMGVSRNALARHLAAGRYLAPVPKVSDDSPGPEIRTTRNLFDTQRYGKRGDTNHCIPLAGPLRTAEADLPIDPWVLGYWLGNGTTGQGTVCCHAEDEGWIRHGLAARGRSAGPTHSPRPGKAPTFSVYGLITELKALGVADDKHVPPVYLRASESQRAALLAGLLDSDGHMEPRIGHIEFCSTRETLADAVTELARSLGQKPVSSKGRAMLKGVDYGPKWRVTWRPTVNPFLSPRKSAAFRPLGAQGLRDCHRMIVRVEEIPASPMRCLTVDSPNSMYLAGEGMIPTHNSRSGAEFAASTARRYPGARIGLVGPAYADGRDTMVEGVSGLLSVLLPAELRGGTEDDAWNRSLGELFMANGSRFKIYSSEKRRQLRGPQFNFIWMDEPTFFADVDQGTGRDSTWYNANIALRLPALPGWDKEYRPRGVITGTPRRVPLLKVPDEVAKSDPSKAGLLQRPASEVAVTTGTTMDNLANLDANYRAAVVDPLIGTTLGRQELGGVMLDDVEGALIPQALIDETRVGGVSRPLVRRVVALDPAGGAMRDEHGVVVMGMAGDRADPEFYILADRSANCEVVDAARRAIHAYREFDAHSLVVEKNMGQDWLRAAIEAVFRDMLASGELADDMPMPRIELVTAVKSKEDRATPLKNRWQQRRMHIVGSMPMLESQLSTWVPGDADSPDRIDAAVHAHLHMDLMGAGVADVASAAGRQGRRGRPEQRAAMPPAGLSSRR